MADATASFRPSAYAREHWDCTLRFRFPIRKLRDLQARWDELEADPNPFALVVLVHLKAQVTLQKQGEHFDSRGMGRAQRL